MGTVANGIGAKVETELEFVVQGDRIVHPVFRFVIGAAFAFQNAGLTIAGPLIPPIKIGQSIGVVCVLIQPLVVVDVVAAFLCIPVCRYRFEQMPHLQLVCIVFRLAKLQSLLEIPLEYPVNAMTRVCKKLSLPKKEALEAIAMYEMAYGGGPATAHDVFMAMQEIPYMMKTCHTREAKLLKAEENMARALSIRWSDYDVAKELKW